MKHTFSSPTTLPVSLTEVKDHLRVTGTGDDPYIMRLIRSAWLEVENYTCRSLITRTVTLKVDSTEVADNNLWLPFGPVSAITSVTAYDANGTGTTVSSGDYYLNGDELVGKSNGFMLNVGRKYLALQVVYSAGYGTGMDNVPEPLRRALITRVADLYEYRQSLSGQAPVSSEGHLWKQIAAPYRQLVLV